MPSPFPGMDPYLEKYWREVHEGLIIYTRDAIQERLPRDLRARIEERVIRERVYSVENPQAAASEEEPLRIRLFYKSITEHYLEIVDASSESRVVTAIEFLSPTNKLQSKNREQYRLQQRQVKRGGASLVEFDLTRGGRWTVAVPRNRVPSSHRTTYRICVWRAKRSGCYDVYRVPLLRPLPSIDIPLRPTDTEVRLDLQPLIDRCYEMGNYDLDYRAEPVPPLEAEDAKLADQWLRDKGLR